MVDPHNKLKRRITQKDLSRMKLNDIEKNAKDLKQKIEKGEIDNYTVNTFTTLCGKAIEELNKNNDELKQFEFMNMMKNVLQMEQVNKLTEMEQKNKDGVSKNINNINNNNIIQKEKNKNSNENKEEMKDSNINKEDNIYYDIEENKDLNKNEEEKITKEKAEENK